MWMSSSRPVWTVNGTTMTSDTSRRRDVVFASTACVVAALARSIVAVSVPDSQPVFDMQEYWERAIYIFQHGRLYESGWRTPGYPGALALTFTLTSGPSLSAARWLNVVAGTLAVLLTYWLARRHSGSRPALVAALVVALYPSFVIYTAFVATETIVTVPLLAALIATTYRTSRAFVAAGAFTGLALLTRPGAVALVPAVLIALAHTRDVSGSRRWSLRGPVIAVTALVITMTPWWLHNARVHGRFIPLDLGGIHLLIGNGPLATGLWESNHAPRLEGEILMGIDWRTPQGSDLASDIAIAEIRAHPLDAVRRIPTKILGLLAIEGREQLYLYSWSYFGPMRAAVIWLASVPMLIAFPVLLLSALAGMTIRHGLEPRVLVPCLIFLLTTLLMHAALYGDSRYHLSMVPVLAVLATGLARWPNGISPWRAATAVVIVLWLAAAWSSQFATFLSVLPRLTAPDGWQARVVYDDLL
jgi:4-amino-4-deoxy-L-arabinose transferase-like glycosyltransferase